MNHSSNAVARVSSPMSAIDDIKRHKETGDRHFRSNQQQLAICSYDRAIEASELAQCPDLLAVLYSNRSAAKLVLKDFQGALKDAQASLAVDDKWIKGWYRSAKALQGLGKTQLALQAAQHALQLEPQNKDVLTLVGELSAAASSRTHKSSSTSSGSPPQHRPQLQQHQQQEQQQQQQPRARLDLRLLPQQLVVGSEYLASPDGVNSNLLLLMHGLGDKPSAFTALAQRMQLPQTACLALSGPFVVPETAGGRAWFEAFDDDGNLIQAHPHEKRRLASLAATLQLLEQLLSGLSAAGGWQPSQVQLLSFSQGGTVALELARRCTGSRRLGGVVAISASLLEEGLHEPESSSVTSTTAASPAGSQGCDVLITHGGCDDVVPRRLVQRSVTALQQSGCSVELHSLPGKGHAMVGSPGEMRLLMAFWGKRLQSRPSDPAFVEVPGRFPNAETAAAAAARATAAHQQARV